MVCCLCYFFFSSRRRHTRYIGDWSSDVCSSDLAVRRAAAQDELLAVGEERALGLEQAGAHLRLRTGDRAGAEEVAGADRRRSEERRVGKECRSGWWGERRTKKADQRG